MTVADLIEELQDLDPNALVVVKNLEGDCALCDTLEDGFVLIDESGVVDFVSDDDLEDDELSEINMHGAKSAICLTMDE